MPVTGLDQITDQDVTLGSLPARVNQINSVLWTAIQNLKKDIKAIPATAQGKVATSPSQPSSSAPNPWPSPTPPGVLEGTHANRPAAGNVTSGTLYYETDRGVIYVSNASPTGGATGAAWLYVAGAMISAYVNQPSDLGLTDAGFQFIASDSLICYYRTGSSWVPITPIMGSTGYPSNDIFGVFPNPVLNSTGVAAGAYGNATHAGMFVVDAKGRINSASNVAITFPSPPTGLTVTVAGAFTVSGVPATNMIYIGGQLGSYQ